MDYLLENLGQERFQQVCQTLLTKAFPKTQCFPIGQRDGGRDATSLLMHRHHDEFSVFQVKFVRNPTATLDPHKWLTDIVRSETPKLEQLIPKGAKEYYLLTNVPGTAFLDAGSIDKVQGILSENLSIPAQCWWRDDLNRRLDDAWDVKWAYPEILRGTDILRLIVERGLSEDGQRRTNAIDAFIRDQFERDNEVRFKQVELQNSLLDLFVDVPINLHTSIESRPLNASEYDCLQRLASRYGDPRFLFHSREAVIGAASVFLNSEVQKQFPRVVIEGAPGQGKSTIVQYICQIHRRRLLNIDAQSALIPEQHRSNPVRIPFRIDCRDFAHWLTKKNPFSASDTEEVPADWQKSLESFLAGSVVHYSGGLAFSAADLVAVAKVSAILLVFDGLDEVADIETRRDVVEEITRGVNRLAQNSVSLQTIVTSRPAAFANSPGLPAKVFRYFELASINQPLINEYAGKWLKARRLDGKEAADVRKILKYKLDQPHLRELARNPMQLAILLSLIHTRGISLPDKRTSLYDTYVELFFSREAEKSQIVREHRDLLVNIHGHLAWLLHSEAQTKGNRGSVSAERLRHLVGQFLVNEGHDSALGDQLFTGMVERVVALVSRVEGTYEFEVQPLREYFAARYLYDTAPYSPTGGERRGALPDRFDALVRDFFWQNVARFYAGCYSKGELPSLVDRLEDLSRSEGYMYTGHAQFISATLLADWVFAQHPKLMKQVVELILNGLGLRYVSSIGRPYRAESPLILPKKSGNDELVARCFDVLGDNPPRDYAHMLIELIRVNSSKDEILERWRNAIQTADASDRTRWMTYGLYMGTLSATPEEHLEQLLTEGGDVQRRYRLLLRAGRAAFLESSVERFTVTVDQILDRNWEVAIRRSTQSVVEVLTQVLQPYRYSCVFQFRSPSPLASLWEHNRTAQPLEQLNPVEAIPDCQLAIDCRTFIDVSLAESQRPADEWAINLAPWEELIESGRKLFGDRWSLCVLANTAAGIKSKSVTCDDASNLFADSVPMCRRARYARLRAGSASWWQSTLDRASSTLDRCFSLLVFITWAGLSVLIKLAAPVGEKLAELDESDW